MVFKVDSLSKIAKYFITDSGYVKIVPLPNKLGISDVKVTATDTSGRTLTTYFVFSIIDSVVSNKFKFRNVYASTFSNILGFPVNAVDNSLTTGWTSGLGQDNEWFLIKLDSLYTLQEMLLNWGGVYGKKYDILVSTDSIHWQTVYAESNGNGNYDKIVFDPVQAKYVLIQGLLRSDATQGYSINEIYGYSVLQLNHPPHFAKLNQTDTVTVNTSTNYTISGLATDQDQGDKVSYTLTLLGGSELPSWLVYNDSTQILKITPTEPNLGSTQLLVTASDVQNAQASDTLTITVINNTLVATVENKNIFNIYPNPTKGLVYLSWNLQSNKPSELSVIDILGKVVTKVKLQPNINFYSLNLSNLREGNYFIKLTTSENVYTKNILLIK